ncbi:putative toxin-antitoxin system toxin component, PIN family [Dyadobacter chenhuakuii]|uniref:Toxin-antitoxin system toxin component, PIN family n=1 Tax=Dyadobacter chenhuakuii TaxID=2909339 RepID=A0A9X1QIY1_9BACT|nr:putative toxin-antitoxin system toxin component, PIN family [Dyadobacter chenhuakuii]MCF2501093.1 putative toxin-antitoxin system toxin component, PIN family [Dyadobacter chenhuakuii]
MNIVLDTNVLLVALPSKSIYHPIFTSLLKKSFDLFVTNEIISEYEEQLSIRLGKDRTDIHLVELLNLPNIHKIDSYYLWQLIEADKDDNKFVDCAIACNADFLVSNDAHYNILATVEFPKVKVIKAQVFLQMLPTIP